MGLETINKIRDSEIHGDFVGRDKTINIIMFKDKEREFVITRNANIKPVSYFTGRETEIRDLRQRIEEGRKSVLVSGMGGIGKTHICRKLFEEYLKIHSDGENCSFKHIGYIEYSGEMASSLQKCLKFKQQDSLENNQEAAWRELEYLASDGKLLLFVDNVDKSINEDSDLQRLKSIPGAVVLTSRLASFSDEFEPYLIGFLDMEQCKEIYATIRFGGSGRNIDSEEVEDLEYIIENLAGRHTITVEFLAHLACTKMWSVRKLREKLEEKGFCLEFHKDGKLVNIQGSYDVLYDMSALTRAEQNILEAFSVFPYIPLSAEKCNKWLFADAGVSEDDNILMGLYQKGWLQFNRKQESYALHPVFAQFIYDKYKPKLEKHQELFKECLAKLKMFLIDYLFEEEGEDLILFAKGIAEKIDMGKSEEQVVFFDYVGNFLDVISKHEDAKKIYEKCIEIYKEVLGEYHLNTARAYSKLAYSCLKWKEYEKAEELYKKSLQIQENLLGEGNPKIITDYYNLANISIIQKKYGEAEALFVKVIRGWGQYDEERVLYENIKAKDDVSISDIYEGLKIVYVKQGEYEKAQEFCKIDWRSMEDVMKEKYPDAAINYSSLASVYCIREEYEVALSYAFEAYEIFKTELGINTLATDVSYELMKEIYRVSNLKDNFERWLKNKERKKTPVFVSSAIKQITEKVAVIKTGKFHKNICQ